MRTLHTFILPILSWAPQNPGSSSFLFLEPICRQSVFVFASFHSHSLALPGWRLLAAQLCLAVSILWSSGSSSAEQMAGLSPFFKMHQLTWSHVWPWSSAWMQPYMQIMVEERGPAKQCATWPHSWHFHKSLSLTFEWSSSLLLWIREVIVISGDQLQPKLSCAYLINTK